MALVLGTAPHLPETFHLALNGTKRTRETFHLANGPGWVLLDYDTDQMPQSVEERIAELGGAVAAMEHVWPGLKEACRVSKPSSSGGVHKSAEEPPTDIKGFHLYVLVSDQSKSKEVLETLQQRAWSEGLGWIKVSASGALLTRSIFDTTVWGPERLVFAGPPELGEGVSRTAPAILGQEGNVLHAPLRPEGAASERALYAAKEAIKPRAAKKERAWRKDQARRIMSKTGISAKLAFKAVEVMHQHRLLEDDAMLEMDDGSLVRVGDLLDQGRKVNKLSMPSPLDGLSYGRGKATLLWSEGRVPVIVDHAHGLRRIFRFARFADVEDQVEGSERLPFPGQLPDASIKGMMALLAESDMGNARPNAMAVANRLFLSVPAQRSIEEVIAWICGCLLPKILPEDFYQALRNRFHFRLSKRKERILAPYTMNANLLNVHHVQHVDSLAGAVEGLPQGVVVVVAPLGFGKTQHVGAPLVREAKTQGRPAMAICHRISLTGELAKRLELANYSHAASQDVESLGGLAVCLPSTTRMDIVEMLPKPKVVFIDEVRQVLAFLASPGQCRTAHATAAGVYQRLRQLIIDAHTVVVADAHMDARTLKFLEECRPGERFQIIIAEPQHVNRTVEFRIGPSPRVRSSVIADIMVELASGGKVWLACESKKFAQAMERHFANLGYRAIAITAETKGRPEPMAFLQDADAASRSYDIVIASPVISSGLSIEHRGDSHFTLVAFLGSGIAITPGDAVQQLARVRYVDRFLVGVMQNNLPHGVMAKQLIGGRSEALALQNDPIPPGDFDFLIAGLEADQANGKADFAAGLFWLLEREGWKVRQGVCDDAKADIKPAMEAERLARVSKLLAAPSHSVAITLEKLRQLGSVRSNTTSEHQARIEVLEIQLEAARIREFLGVRTLLPDDIQLWDERRLQHKLERFIDLFGLENLEDCFGPKLFSERQLRAARREMYTELFAGFDIAAHDWLTPQAADHILDRVMRKPALYAACGIVGLKYASGFINKLDQIKPLRRPSHAVREVKAILERAGLGARGKQSRVSQKGPILVNTRGANCDKSRVWRYTTQDLWLMHDLARVWRETQLSRWDLLREMPISILQLKRSLPQVSQWLKDAIERSKADDSCVFESDS